MVKRMPKKDLDEQDFRQIARELVRALRGTHSQVFISKKLGSSINQVYRWESGYRSIDWLDFVSLCKITKAPLKTVLNLEMGFYGGPEDARALVRHLQGQSSITTLAKINGLSRSIVSRWVNGTSTPGLHDILRLTHRPHGILPSFITSLTDSEIPSLKPLIRLQILRKQAQFRYPEVSVILMALNIEAHHRSEKPSEEWLSQFLEMPLPRLNAIIEEMLAAQYIERSGQKLQRVIENFDTRGDATISRRLRKYWLEDALDKLDKFSLDSPHRFAQFVFAASEENDRLMRKALYEFVAALKTICSEDRGSLTQIRSLNIQDILVVGARE